MNDFAATPDPVLDPLFARARAQRADTSRAEYAFETRLAARLRTPARSPWGLVAWKMMPVFALIVLGLACWQREVGSASEEAAQTAVVENPEAADMLASFN